MDDFVKHQTCSKEFEEKVKILAAKVQKNQNISGR